MRYRLITLGLLAAAMAQLAFLALRGGPLDSRLEVLAEEAILAAIGLATALLPRLAETIAGALSAVGRRLKLGARVGWVAVLSLLPVAVLGGAGRFFEPIGIRLVTLWLLALAGTSLVEAQ